MNDESSPGATPMTGDQQHSALLGALVMQQVNMAMIFLGQHPHPETGKAITDTAAASMFIDTLEMLAAKTKGNLSKAEDQLLQRSLTDLRMVFVEAVNAAPKADPSPSASPAPDLKSSAPPSGQPGPEEPGAAAAEDTRKKFVKKY